MPDAIELLSTRSSFKAVELKAPGPSAAEIDKLLSIAWRRQKADAPVDPVRSALMARVRQRGSAPELAVRAALKELGIRFRAHHRSLAGKPDIYISRLKLAIFVHGCFWHRHRGCSKTTTPKTRRVFWLQKFERNVARDARNIAVLRRLGWKVLVIWECQSTDRPRLLRRLSAAVKQCEQRA
jgi:DNA mismatch endonuclease, patch repair protein